MNATNVTPAYLLMTLLPFATDEMRRAEQMFANGADKLKSVLAYVRGIYESTSGPAAFGISFDELEPQMSLMVAEVVSFKNATGAFTKQELKAA